MTYDITVVINLHEYDITISIDINDSLILLNVSANPPVTSDALQYLKQLSFLHLVGVSN